MVRNGVIIGVTLGLLLRLLLPDGSERFKVFSVANMSSSATMSTYVGSLMKWLLVTVIVMVICGAVGAAIEASFIRRR